MYVYVCMYVCKYVFYLFICLFMYVFMYVFTYLFMHVFVLYRRRCIQPLVLKMIVYCILHVEKANTHAYTVQLFQSDHILQMIYIDLLIPGAETDPQDSKTAKPNQQLGIGQILGPQHFAIV